MSWLRRGVFQYIETGVANVTFSTAERPYLSLCVSGGRVCTFARACVCTCERICDSVRAFVCICARTHIRSHHRRCELTVRSDHVCVLYKNNMYPSLC